MRRLVLLSLALGLVPACGGDDATSDEASSSGGSGADVNVSLSEYTIDPSAIAVDPGSYTFHVVNDGSTVHALEVEGPNGEVETEHLEPGESADLTVDLQGDGEFEMYCPVADHRERGMEGTITAGAGGGGGTTTDETTTEDEDEDKGSGSGGYGY
jgi:plastocyanin